MLCFNCCNSTKIDDFNTDYADEHFDNTLFKVWLSFLSISDNRLPFFTILSSLL